MRQMVGLCSAGHIFYVMFAFFCQLCGLYGFLKLLWKRFFLFVFFRSVGPFSGLKNASSNKLIWSGLREFGQVFDS